MPKGRKAPPGPRTSPQQNQCIAIARETEREAAIALLEQGRRAGGKLPLAQQAAWLAQQLVAQLSDTSGSACRSGCAWCCSLFVSASAPEILRIADYLRATRSGDELARLREQLAQRELALAGTTAVQRTAARRPCVLLVDRQCSVYPVRPLACSSFNSTSAERCEESWRQGWELPISANQIQLWLYGGVMLGLRDGLDAQQLDSAQLDLVSALRIALDTPDAATRWLAGEPIFAPARIALER